MRLAVLVSGRGSNLKAILEAVAGNALDVAVAGVFSDRPEPPAFQYALRYGVPAFAVIPEGGESRVDYDLRLAGEVRGVRPQAVALAGFMRVLSPAFLEAFPDRVLNIHPALLPSFRGLDAQEQAVRAGVRFSGCTVHFVDEGTDTGPIILQSVVPVHQEDTADTLAARILVKEHRTYPAALQLLAEGRLRIRGRRVLIDWEDRQPRRPRDCVSEWREIRDARTPDESGKRPDPGTGSLRPENR
jgi:phosphoribosylglycinamide formyltransferase-1